MKFEYLETIRRDLEPFKGFEFAGIKGKQASHNRAGWKTSGFRVVTFTCDMRCDIAVTDLVFNHSR